MHEALWRIHVALLLCHLNPSESKNLICINMEVGMIAIFSHRENVLSVVLPPRRATLFCRKTPQKTFRHEGSLTNVRSMEIKQYTAPWQRRIRVHTREEKGKMLTVRVYWHPCSVTLYIFLIEMLFIFTVLNVKLEDGTLQELIKLSYCIYCCSY